MLLHRTGQPLELTFLPDRIPGFPYRILWEERQILSVANLTRQDGTEFLRLATQIGIETQTTTYPLGEANRALSDLRGGKFEGAAVLIPEAKD